MSIEDYKSQGAYFITIERDKLFISSMMNRAGQTKSQAEKEFDSYENHK